MPTVPDPSQPLPATTLDESQVDPDPMRQFAAWFHEALAASVSDAHAMTLATATPAGRPSARMVLLKGYDERGFAFYTNYESRKGEELAANPVAALAFYWPELQRQVRVTGGVSRLSAQESDAYFHTRPLGSRVGAWTSRQSVVVGSRADLDRRYEEVLAQYSGGDVPRPPHWGGFLVAPDTVEFWQGRPNRLHDRLRYSRDRAGAWRMERLAP